MDKLTIVIPTFNESKNIENLVSQISEHLKAIEYEILFIDDSNDNTPDVINEVAKKDSHVRLFHRENEKGLGTAVLKGFKIADGDYIAVMDADLQHPPAILKGMYSAIKNGADFCIPSRFIPGGSDGGLNLYRKLVSGTARYIGKIFLPSLRKITDPTSGIFMFRKEILNINEELKPIGWKIMIEVLALANYRTIIEIPYEFSDRAEGESKLSAKVTQEYLKQVIGLMRRGKKQKQTNISRWTIDKMLSEEKKYFN